MITGTTAFFEGPQGIQRLEPLAQRLNVDFKTDFRFDNPRAVQIRLPAFTLERLRLVGCKIRDIYSQHALSRRASRCCATTIMSRRANAVRGRWVARSAFAPDLRQELVSDVLDWIDQFEDFDPRTHYGLTISESSSFLSNGKPWELQASMRSNWNCEPLRSVHPRPSTTLSTVYVRARCGRFKMQSSLRFLRVTIWSSGAHRGREDRGRFSSRPCRGCSQRIGRSEHPFHLSDQGLPNNLDFA